MKILVLGCSYSHGDLIIDDSKKTYSGLIAKHNPELYVINAAMPGISNDLYHLILEESIKYYGKPDVILCQLTSAARTFYPFSRDYTRVSDFRALTDNYVSSTNYGPINDGYINLTRGSILNEDRIGEIASIMGISERTFKEYYLTLFENFSYQEFQTLRNIKLLNGIIPKDCSIIYYSWIHDSIPPSAVEYIQQCEDENITWLGSIDNILRLNERNYSADKYHHLNEEGHQKLFEVFVEDKLKFLKGKT